MKLISVVCCSSRVCKLPSSKNLKVNANCDNIWTPDVASQSLQWTPLECHGFRWERMGPVEHWPDSKTRMGMHARVDGSCGAHLIQRRRDNRVQDRANLSSNDEFGLVRMLYIYLNSFLSMADSRWAKRTIGIPTILIVKHSKWIGEFAGKACGRITSISAVTPMNTDFFYSKIKIWSISLNENVKKKAIVARLEWHSDRYQFSWIYLFILLKNKNHP